MNFCYLSFWGFLEGKTFSYHQPYAAQGRRHVSSNTDTFSTRGAKLPYGNP